jgi:hypothetical protein
VRLLLFLKSFFFFFGYFNVIYNHIFLSIFSVAYYRYNRLIDKGILEILGPFGFYKFFRFLSVSLLNIQPYQVFFILG